MPSKKPAKRKKTRKVNEFLRLWNNTIWGGRPNRYKSRNNPTIWGSVRGGYRHRPDASKTAHLKADGLDQSLRGTIWDNKAVPPWKKARSIITRHRKTLMLHAYTIWGLLPLWDGREASYYPGDEPYGKRVKPYMFRQRRVGSIREQE